MHVVFVLPRFFPYRGGYENSLLSLARYLVAHKQRVTVFTTVANDIEAFWLPGFKTFPEEQTVLDGITVRRFPICYDKARRRASRVLGLAPYWRWRAQHWRPSFRVPGLAEALAQIEADVIHIGPLPYNSLMYQGIRAGERRNIPVVATPCLHAGEIGNNEVAQHYAASHQIEMLRRCNRVLCMTQAELDLLANLGVPTSRLGIAPHGTSLAAATGGDAAFLAREHKVNGPVVLHLGMKAYEKGSGTLVEAMKLLWARGSTAWLVMAGPSVATFDRYIEVGARDCPKLVNLPPFADADKRNLLASATVVAQPSRVESLGLVLIEAWANRKPVIAADIAVSRALVSASGGGVTVPFGNAAKLAEAIEHLLDDRALRDKMGAGGYNTALQYDGESCWQRIMEELQDVVSQGMAAAKP
jgi:glycogen synthase